LTGGYKKPQTTVDNKKSWANTEEATNNYWHKLVAIRSTDESTIYLRPWCKPGMIIDTDKNTNQGNKKLIIITVLYSRKVFCPKISPKNQPYISFTTV